MAKPKARSHGEGTIYKRKDGRYVASTPLPPGPDGARRRRTAYRDTRKAAALALAEMKAELAKGLDGSADRITVAQLLERWLEDVIRPSPRAPSTTRAYAFAARSIAAHVGAVTLARLTPAHVQGYLNAQRAAGLAPATISLRLTVLRGALRTAERWGLVARNVASLVDGPTVTRPERVLITPELGRAILAAVAGHRYGPLWTTALGLGLRFGEVAGLRRSDVDFARGRIRIEQQVPAADRWHPRRRKAGGALELPLPRFVAAALAEEGRRRAAARVAAGDRWRGDYDALVFTNTIGSPVMHRHALKRFHQVLARAGLPDMRQHDLRHGCATILLGEGVPLKTIQEILGHRKFATTADLYAHVLPRLVGDAMDRLQGALDPTERTAPDELAGSLAVNPAANIPAMPALPGGNGRRTAEGTT